VPQLDGAAAGALADPPEDEAGEAGDGDADEGDDADEADEADEEALSDELDEARLSVR
jgi:hypothetical protein